MSTTNPQIFLSYCWNDSNTADEIYNQLIIDSQITLHRDKLDIRHWGSIKEYMQSIPDMDYTILLISDAYLKSPNCMYEVLEVMRDRRYKDKIFPAVICTDIYKPIKRAEYVKYWQEKYQELKGAIQGIDAQNLGTLTEDLKRYQDIAANIVTFIDTIADMNNPEIKDVSAVIKDKLMEKGFISGNGIKVSPEIYTLSPFTHSGIQPVQQNVCDTDYDVNQFMIQSFQKVCRLFGELCRQYEKQNVRNRAIVEQIDTRNSNFRFYVDGMQKAAVRIGLKDMAGKPGIWISNNLSATSWNNWYNAVKTEGQLKLKSMMSMFGATTPMDADGVVKDIWENHVEVYLR